MKGLELSRRYFEEVGLPALRAACPELVERMAFGLVGEGSECLGYDDEFSQDHDWGPGFCIWLTHGDFPVFGSRIQRVYESLPRAFLGFRRLRENPMSMGRVGVLDLESFYYKFLGLDGPPRTLGQWFTLPESGLAACTNGVVFADGPGEFTAFRNALLSYYPEDVRLKKLAARCALAAQSGQYNYTRCLRRGEQVAAMQALGEFVTHIQGAVFLLNRRYMPFYKWTHRALGGLPLLGNQAASLLSALPGTGDGTPFVEALSALVIDELKRQGLSVGESRFLLDHGVQVMEQIESAGLRALSLMAL